MIRLALYGAVIAAMLGGAIASAAEQCVYLSAGGKITVYQVDPATYKLTVLQEAPLSGAGPLGVSRDKTMLYAAAQEEKAPAIATFRVGSDGKLTQVAISKVNLRPGYLMTDADDRFLAGSHYGPGKATLWRLEDGVFRGDTAQEITLEKNAHSSIFAPNNRWLLVPATGPNKVFQIRFNQKLGALAMNKPAYASGPQGESEAQQPRHLIFHPELPIAYTTLERTRPGVGVWNWNEQKGLLAPVQNLVTQREEHAELFITTADLHLTPNAKYLYVSNRDTTERGSKTGNDSIVAFSVDGESGRLTQIGHFACEHVPRSFAIDELGACIFVAGQNDDRLGAYAIDDSTGKLKKLEQYKTGSSPSWVHCMSPPSR